MLRYLQFSMNHIKQYFKEQFGRPLDYFGRGGSRKAQFGKKKKGGNSQLN